MREFLLIVIIIFGSHVIAQNDSVREDLSKTHRYFRANYDNDFFNATDRYYTQGVYFEFIAPFLRKSPLSRILIPLNKRSQDYYGFVLEQDCFTPGSIRYDTLNYLDRPYAATMYVSQFLNSLDSLKKRRLNSRIDLGIIGPCAVCEQEQKWIHRGLANIPPLGWEYQMSQDYILNYSLGIEQGLFSLKYLDMLASADLRAGTIYDDISFGLMARVGFMADYFSQLGIRKHAVKNKFQCYLFARGKTRFVGYNALVQGGLFDSDIHSLPDRLIMRYVFTGSTGIVIAYKRVSVEYTKVYSSPEFLNGKYHGWGHCNFTFCF
jgi:lipid A 3-O-deacylase